MSSREKSLVFLMSSKGPLVLSTWTKIERAAEKQIPLPSHNACPSWLTKLSKIRISNFFSTREKKKLNRKGIKLKMYIKKTKKKCLRNLIT